MSLTTKLLFLVISIIILMLAGSYYFQSKQIRLYLEQSQLEWISTLTNSVSEGVAKDTINGNKYNVREILRRIAEDEAIEYAYVTDMEGNLFAHSFGRGFPRFLLDRIYEHSETISKAHYDRPFQTKQGEVKEFDAPLVKGLSARIHIGVTQSEVNALIWKVRQDLFWFISLLGAISILMAVVIGKRINSPLTDFSKSLLAYNKSSNNQFPHIKTSDPDIKNLINVFHSIISERDITDEALKRSQNRLMLHRELSPLGIIEWTTDFIFVDCNPAAEKIFGFSKKELVGKHIYKNILPESAREQVDKIWEALVSNTGGAHSINENLTKEGKIITCEWHNTPLVNDEGVIVGVASYVQDVTHQQQQEEVLRRTQKMDALGKLTGGIAHDYNNMLGVILGYTEILQLNLEKQPELLEYVDEIQHAGERGAKLTQRLLGFSRPKIAEASELSLNELLRDRRDMLEKTLTVRIKLVFELKEDLWSILGDSSEIEDLILNISINAMHAMPDGGQLTFVTKNESVSPSDATHMGLSEGEYVVLVITDTGIGMDSETLSHIFEPFYSTKGHKGTGLGLSQVYGLVNRSGGAIKVYSELNHGSRFAIYLPRYESSSSKKKVISSEVERTDFSGTEKLLVVDDEVALGTLTKDMLETQGYTIQVTNSALKALDILSSEKFDAVITDIIMPEMDGYELAEQILLHYPEVKVQLISGFNDNRHQDKAPENLQQQLLYKPVNSKVLIRQIREMLDS